MSDDEVTALEKRLDALVSTQAENIETALAQAREAVNLLRNIHDAQLRQWSKKYDDLLERFDSLQHTHVNTSEKLRRVVLFAQQNTNFMHVDDLCEHGAEGGCCSTCSAMGPRS